MGLLNLTKKKKSFLNFKNYYNSLTPTATGKQLGNRLVDYFAVQNFRASTVVLSPPGTRAFLLLLYCPSCSGEWNFTKNWKLTRRQSKKTLAVIFSDVFPRTTV